MLIRPGQPPEEAVYLWFVGERPRASHPFPSPSLAPEERLLPDYGLSILSPHSGTWSI